MRKRLVSLVLAGLLALGALPLSPAAFADPADPIDPAESTPGAAFYVATDGSDSNPGTLAAPFQTLEHARDAVRTLKQEDGLPAGGVTVYLREGRYERTASFELREQDSGEAGKPVTYKAYPGETVRLTGGRQLEKSGFAPVTDSAILSRIISADARSKVLVYDLAGHGITDYGVMSRHGYYLANDLSQVPPMELYVNGQGMTLARWPNEGTVQMDQIIDAGPTRKDADLQDRGGTFSYTYDRPQYWTQADDIWLDGIFGYSWEWSYNKIAAIDTTNKTITLRYGEMSGLFKNWYPDFHFAQNLLEEIDMPGEYYIDRDDGKLYYLPNAEFAQSADPDITVTMLRTPMINALNVSYVSFEELILEDGRDSAAVISGGSHTRIANSEIRNFTNSGVLINTQSRFYYSDIVSGPGTYNGVENTHIHHIGGTAVTLTGGDKTTLAPGHNYVENSHIHDFAYYHKAYNPGVHLSGVGNVMSHNVLHDAPHPGVLIFGNDHLVEYNEIYDVCKNFSDLGAIYMNLGEKPQERGTVIRRNYFHNIGEGKAGVQGIYPDNFTMGLTIEENIFYKMGNSAILNNGGAHIETRHNIFVDSKVPYDYADLYLGDEPDDQVPLNYMPKWEALFDANNDFVGTPYLTKYPELADFFTENRYYPDTNTFAENVVYNPTVPRSVTTNVYGAYDKFELVQYSGNWVTTTDPGFVNLAAGDLSLAPNAPVFTQIPGFPNIPFGDIGIVGKAGPTAAPDDYPVTGVAVYNDEVTVDRWKTAKLQTAVLPWDASRPGLDFVSADPAIATVDAAGVVTGQAVGDTVVTATSQDNPAVSAQVTVHVAAGDGVMDMTDFESGANGWPQDANRSIVTESGNHWYKLLDGASALKAKNFSDYELRFKIKTPAAMPDTATLYIFDRQSGSGSTRIGYKNRADGTSSWLLYNSAWQILKEVKLPSPDLQPNTEYDIKLLARGGDLSVYVDGAFRLKGTDPGHNASGQVGFYISGMSQLLIDDIQFKAPTTDLAGILPAETDVRMVAGEQRTLAVSLDPADAAETGLVWTTSDPSVATVDANGLANAVSEGEATITVTSAVYAHISADIKLTVSNVLHFTDFEAGGNGWPVDPNRSIYADGTGNRWYKILNGATGLLDRTFTAYQLEFKLKTPATMPSGGTLYIFDRQDSSGSTRIGYKTRADGTSAWLLYNPSWTVLKTVELPGPDLLPNTTYDLKVVAKDALLKLYVNGDLRLSGYDPNHRPSGKVGFYVSGFDYLLFDDVKLSVVPEPAGGSGGALLTEVPYAIDSSNQAGWWSPLDTYGTGLEYAYMAYNAPGSTSGTHKVYIARRDGTGAWSNIPVMNGSAVAEYTDDVGHNQPSIARDGSGRFHVFASMHDNTWRYFRSDTAGGAPQNHSADMPDQTMLVSYPIVKTAPNGDLYLFVRAAQDAAGKRNGVLLRWDNAASTWSQIGMIASTLNRSVYPDDLAFDANGDLHIIFEWAQFAASALRHQLSYLKYSPATGTFSKADGTVVSTPVSLTTADIVQPMSTGEAYVQSGNDPGGPGVQSAKLTIDAANRPVIAYRYREAGSNTFAVKQATRSGSGWSLQTVYDASETTAAIDVTWTGTQSRVYYATADGDDRVYMAVQGAAGWTSTSIAPGKPIERLAVERNANGVDILYLVDIMNLKLYYGRN